MPNKQNIEKIRSIQDLLKNIPASPKAPLSAEELMLQAAEISRQAAEKLAEERVDAKQRKADSLLRRAQIPSRYANASLDGGMAKQAEAYAAARDFVGSFDDRLKTGGGLLLWGDIGTGKTHLACAIANALRMKLRPVLYCTALEAVMLVKASWKKSSDGLTEYDVYERFGDPELLIIDEIGVQMGSDFERMVLTSIADIRSRNCLPTIIVSNLPPAEIHGLLGERMFDRLVGFDAEVVRMRGPSLRKLRVA